MHGHGPVGDGEDLHLFAVGLGDPDLVRGRHEADVVRARCQVCRADDLLRLDIDNMDQLRRAIGDIEAPVARVRRRRTFVVPADVQQTGGEPADGRRRERRRISKEILANAGFMVKTGSLVETKPINESAPLDVIGSIMMSVMGKQSVRQVITIAAKYEVNGSNTDLLTAFTFLNPADEYDEVIALEHLAERVRGNAVLRVKATERDVFYGIEGRLVGLADTYRKEFLMGAPKAAPVSQNNDQAVTVEV